MNHKDKIRHLKLPYKLRPNKGFRETALSVHNYSVKYRINPGHMTFDLNILLIAL